MTPAEELRFHLDCAYHELAQPGARVRIPQPQRLMTGPVEGHFHLRAELFLQRSSGTRFRFPNEEIDLGPGEILVVPARLHHAETILAGGDPFRNVVLYADEEALSCHLADEGKRGGPQIAYPENREGPGCGRVARWLEDTIETHRELGPTPVADMVRSVLALTRRLLDQPRAPGGEEPLLVVRCRRLVHERLGDPGLSVATLARELGCSADYLSHLFRTVRGEKLTSAIEEQRLRRAAELLTQTALSCKEVAWASGFANQSYFARCFRRRWGRSPGEWREAPLTTRPWGRFAEP